MITKFNYKDKSIKSYAIRKLTCRECFRLMSCREKVIDVMQSTVAQAKERVKGWFGKGKDEDMAISASQQYKQAGNSIVVDVLKYIYEQLWYPEKKKEEKQQLDMFDMFFPEDKLPDAPRDGGGVKHILTTFSGYDSQLMAADALKEDHPDFEWDCVGWSDIDKYACGMHDIVFPQYADKALGDITKIDWNAVKESLNGEDVDLFTYSSPCFVTGTLVLTDKGFVNIEEITKEYKVLTHTNSFKQVVTPMQRKYKGDIYTISPMCANTIQCTPEHPFYVRERYRYGHKSIRAFKEPTWVQAKDLTKNHYLGIAINQESKLPGWNGSIDNRWGHQKPVNTLSQKFEDGNFWYLMGRYIGDGWSRNNETHKAIIIACSDRNTESLLSCVQSLGYNYTHTHERTCDKVTINCKELSEFVQRYGYKACNKYIDADTMNLPVELLRRFMEGYLDSDGCRDDKYYKIATTSKMLTYGIVQCVAKAYHAVPKVNYCKRPATTVIEGRVVNQKDSYNVSWKIDVCKQDKAFYEDGYIWFPINHINTEYQECTVYNLEAEDDHSYTANGVIVHNCQDISQAGKQMGLKEGSGSRSALLWNVSDAVEVLKPKYLLQENVAALVSNKFMPDFQLWLKRLESLGYVSVWTKLNAKNYGVPQNRDRVFVLSMRKDVAFDYQFPKPFELTKKLEDVLEDEVEEKYFLKDDAVSKFLKANDKDSAVFVQFGLSPTHENAMFLKTWLTMAMDALKMWELTPTALEEEMGKLKPKFMEVFEHWRQTGEFPGDAFEEAFRVNMERKVA